jgi:hypothetical protein
MNFLDPFEKDEQRFFQFNKVYVIETLLDPDTRTGKQLFDDLLNRTRHRHNWFDSSYKHVTSKKQLFAYLAEIKRDTLGGRIFPLIHIEGHGNPKGLSVGRGADKAIVKWEGLATEFRKINVATKNNLLLVVASCHGSEIYRGIRVADRAPFFGFIAPIEKVTENEIAEGFNTFYDRIINTTEFDQAVLALRGGHDGSKPRFTYIHSETAFRIVGEKLSLKLRDPVDRLVKLLGIERVSDMQARHKLTYDQLVERTKHVLDKRDDLLNTWMDTFTMKDLGEPS